MFSKSYRNEPGKKVESGYNLDNILQASCVRLRGWGKAATKATLIRRKLVRSMLTNIDFFKLVWSKNSSAASWLMVLYQSCFHLRSDLCQTEYWPLKAWRGENKKGDSIFYCRGFIAGLWKTKVPNPSGSHSMHGHEVCKSQHHSPIKAKSSHLTTAFTSLELDSTLTSGSIIIV